jgi:hypothetical protein
LIHSLTKNNPEYLSPAVTPGNCYALVPHLKTLNLSQGDLLVAATHNGLNLFVGMKRHFREIHLGQNGANFITSADDNPKCYRLTAFLYDNAPKYLAAGKVIRQGYASRGFALNPDGLEKMPVALSRGTMYRRNLCDVNQEHEDPQTFAHEQTPKA